MPDTYDHITLMCRLKAAPVSYTHLIHGVIPAKLAHHRKIITILSDEQISCINEYRKTCNSPIELRDAAMVDVYKRQTMHNGYSFVPLHVS